MSKLILCLDIGNSYIAGFEYNQSEHRFVNDWKLAVSDWFSLPNEDQYEFVYVASVVPELSSKMQEMYPKKVIDINFQLINGIDIELDDPIQVGIDRLMNALSAYQKYQMELLILDLGTALTGCYVTQSGQYKGGFILPGLELSSRSLADHTAKIPKVTLSSTQDLYGKDTESAVRVGVMKGYQHLINGFIDEYRFTYPNIKVIGTGAGIKYLNDLRIDEFEPYLIRDAFSYLIRSNKV